MNRLPRTLLPLLLLGACADAESSGIGERAAVIEPLAEFAPTDEQRDGVVHTVQRLFDALETGDAALLQTIMDPTVVMHSTETRDGNTTFSSSSVAGLAERISSSDVPLIERMWDPVVAVNGAMATLWTPYDFYIGDTFSHCGVDAVTLMLRDDGWKIVALTWTRLQPPACELHPDGPPV